MKKRLFAAILAALLICCLLPTGAVAATGSALQLDTGGIQAGDEVYFGQYTDGTTYDVPWIVLNTSGFMLSKYLLGESLFHAVLGGGYYDGGTLQGYMDTNTNSLYNTMFSTLEKGAIIKKENLICADGFIDDVNSPLVAEAHLYPLSYNEAARLGWGSAALQAKNITAQGGGNVWWWLRSSESRTYVFCVSALGNSGDAYTFHANGDQRGVRPALNLDLSTALLTSAAVGGKASGAAGAGGLAAVSTVTPTTGWKLTLKDAARNRFSIYTTALTATSFTVAYANAKTGTNEYISAMIVDNGSVTHYGRIRRLASASDASGAVTVNLPTGVTLDNDTTLRIFNEQYNGDYKTDYASVLERVSLTVNAPAADIPKTGDSSLPLLWAGLALLAGAGLAASAWRKRVKQGG